MSCLPIARLIAAALFLYAVPASAEQIQLDLAGALARARAHAPAAIAARGEIAIARSAVTGADVAFVENPELAGGVGPRLTDTHPIDFEIGLQQNLEPWRHSPRRAVARAGVAQAQAVADASLNTLELDVALAFYDAVFARRTAELAQRSEDLARGAADVAARRRKAGEITDLDVNLARTALGRATSSAHAAHAEQARTIGRLGALIGAAVDDVIVVTGNLEPVAVPDLDALHVTAKSRADVRLHESERALAIAERDQAIANGRPEISLWATYKREDRESVILGGLNLRLPIWNRGSGDKAAATAKEQRANDSRTATLRAANREIADAYAAYTASRDAVAVFEHDVLPLLDDSDQLMTKAMEAGQIAFSDYLVARQQVLDGRREYLERLLARARSAATVKFAAGSTP